MVDLSIKLAMLVHCIIIVCCHWTASVVGVMIGYYTTTQNTVSCCHHGGAWYKLFSHGIPPNLLNLNLIIYHYSAIYTYHYQNYHSIINTSQCVYHNDVKECWLSCWLYNDKSWRNVWMTIRSFFSVTTWHPSWCVQLNTKKYAG